MSRHLRDAFPRNQPVSRAHDELTTGVLALTMAATMLGPNAVLAAELTPTLTQPKQDNTIVREGAKSQPATIAQSDATLLGRTDSTPVPVLVKLDYDPITGYDGDIPGLAATNPSKTGRKLSQNRAAVDAYTRYVVSFESQVLDRIAARIPAAKVRQSFRTIYGGVAMTLPANRIDDLLSIDGVVAVRQDSLEQPQRTFGPSSKVDAR
jgi:hypothetical protein